MNLRSSLLLSVSGKNGSLFCRDGTRHDGMIRLEETGIAALSSDDRGTIVLTAGLLAVLANIGEAQEVPPGVDRVSFEISQRISIDAVPVDSDGQTVRFSQVAITTKGGAEVATERLDSAWAVFVPRLRLPELPRRRIERVLERLGRGPSGVALIDVFEMPKANG